MAFCEVILGNLCDAPLKLMTKTVSLSVLMTCIIISHFLKTSTKGDDGQGKCQQVTGAEAEREWEIGCLL